MPFCRRRDQAAALAFNNANSGTAGFNPQTISQQQAIAAVAAHLQQQQQQQQHILPTLTPYNSSAFPFGGGMSQGPASFVHQQQQQLSLQQQFQQQQQHLQQQQLLPAGYNHPPSLRNYSSIQDVASDEEDSDQDRF